MKTPLRPLLIEDSDDDARLLLRALAKGGYEVSHVRVQTSAEMRRALAEGAWEIVLSDYSLPSFNALEALAILKESGLDLPFVILSGTIGEETAVEAMKAGAHDFLVKGRLARLVPVVERELREAAHRRERRELQSQLALSDRMASVGTLAAGVAHEINNPLAAVLANLDMAIGDVMDLGEGNRPREELRSELRDARDAAERVRVIVRDLKVFSRVEEDRREAVDVRRVLDSTIRIAWNEIRHRARLVKNYEEVPAVSANESRLGQVFLNLIVNAAQAIPEGRTDANEIRITTFLDEAGRVAVEIRDTGCGVPPEARTRLFTPFFTTKPQGMGTGLGLSICHRIVTSFGGEIDVASVPGEGSAFTVRLPAFHEAPVEYDLLVAPSHGAGAKGRVLVVDDEPMVASAVRRVLAGDHEVTVDNGAREALERLRAGERYDIILCDLMMPEMTGMDLYDEVLLLAPEQAERMLFLSGGAFTPRGVAFLEKVPNPRIDKPFDAACLRLAVRERMRELGERADAASSPGG